MHVQFNHLKNNWAKRKISNPNPIQKCRFRFRIRLSLSPLSPLYALPCAWLKRNALAFRKKVFHLGSWRMKCQVKPCESILWFSLCVFMNELRVTPMHGMSQLTLFSRFDLLHQLDFFVWRQIVFAFEFMIFEDMRRWDHAVRCYEQRVCAGTGHIWVGKSLLVQRIVWLGVH